MNYVIADNPTYPITFVSVAIAGKNNDTAQKAL